jgi:hypothetical protein
MVTRSLVLPILAICTAQAVSTAEIPTYSPSSLLVSTVVKPDSIELDFLSLGIHPNQVSTYVGITEGSSAFMEIIMIHAVRSWSGGVPDVQSRT